MSGSREVYPLLPEVHAAVAGFGAAPQGLALLLPRTTCADLTPQGDGFGFALPAVQEGTPTVFPKPNPKWGGLFGKVG